MSTLLKQLHLNAIMRSKEIQVWLDQFPNNKRCTAIDLLCHLQFMPIDSYSKWLQGVLANLPSDQCAIYAVRKIEKCKNCLWDRYGAVINRPSSTLGSEDLVYSIINKVCRSRSDKYFDHPAINVLRNNKVHDIVLLDDSIGSGKRVSDFILLMMDSRTFKSWWSSGFIQLYVISFARTKESEKTILKSLPGSNHWKRKNRKSSKIQFISERVLSEKNRSGQWGENYKNIVDLCDSTEKVEKRFRRGFGKVMANLVFYHSVPNNIPGVFWFTHKKWQPLFPGRTLPKWLPTLLDVPRKNTDNSMTNSISPTLIQLLHLIKSGFRRESSLAFKLNLDNTLLQKLLTMARSAGFISDQNQLTETGVGIINKNRILVSSKNYDRSLYVPKKWCTVQLKVQPLDHNEKTLWEKADSTNGFPYVDGEFGQNFLEISDAKTAAPYLIVTTQKKPSESWEGHDDNGASKGTSKER
ncbi:MAG: hypothetical protein MUF15_11235 [Acidobacteria bacterium]|jgi:hypothetical protein|nr:hypothetical protein [Acidobacteriota bacterium]